MSGNLTAPIIGNSEIVESPDGIARPTPHQSYMSVARAIAPATELIAREMSGAEIPLSLLAAHQAECLLKAFLARHGKDSHLRGQNLRHNLAALWTEAVLAGLQVPSIAPAWLERLSALHDRPYNLRYSSGLHGIVLPNPQAMAEGLRDLMLAVGESP